MSPVPGLAPVDEAGFLGGRVRLRQPRRGHRAGTDAALVVAAARAHAQGRVCDLGAGVGVIGLSLAVLDPALAVLLVEIDQETAGLAAANACLNGCAARAEILVEHVEAIAGAAPAPWSGACHLVVTNPPFMEARRAQASPDPGRARAHVMPSAALAHWAGAASALLRPKGTLVLIHRPEGLAALLAALQPHFGGVALLCVHPRLGEPATRILVAARKGARAALGIAPPLVLHEADGSFTPLAAAIHRGEAELTFG